MTVHVLATGGTISSHFDGEQWVNLDGRTLVAELGALSVAVTVSDIAAGPSSSLGSDAMVMIARQAQSAIAEGADGVVVVHGTDTMELTAFTTQLLLGTDTTRAPVVFTGSMRPHSHPQADGADNLRSAIAVAAHPGSRGRDVMVCLDGRLHAADRVHKYLAMSIDAFGSSPFPDLGSVTDDGVRFTSHSPVRRPVIDLTGPVPLVTCHPGMSIDALAHATQDAKAVVVEGFGDLNIPNDLWGPLLDAAERGTLVVLASSAFTTNRGDAALRAVGIVGAGGLTAQKARLAVMAALGSTSDRAAAIDFLDQYALTYDAGDRSTTS